MPRKFSDTSIRLITPLTLIISSALSQGAIVPPFTAQKLGLLLRLTLLIYLTFEGGRFAVLYIQRLYPKLNQTKKRLAASYLAAFVISFAVISVSTMINRFYIEKPLGFWDESLINLIQCFWIGILVAAPYELYYSYRALFIKEQEQEQLRRTNIQNQLNLLRNQLNPHFLFNSLNTLSALIRKDPAQAEEFAVEMSALYRAFLKGNKNILIPLKEELDFVHSYLHLLKARFGRGLHVRLSVHEESFTRFLPAFSLQLLIENAIKHNEVDEDKPLEILIQSTDTFHLKVVNNLQKKQTMHATGFGLSGILSQYAHLNLPQVVIEETKQEFIVTLPLVNNLQP